jgi:serine/threonine-protein kinase
VSERESDPKSLGGAPTVIAFSTEPTPPPDLAGRGAAVLPPGALLAGRYEVVALVGRGGMGTVYIADDRLLGERVALKVLDLAAGSTHEALEGLRGEVRLARKVTHPNVVRIHDLVEQGGEVFLTMELVLGTDLRRVLLQEGGWLSAERAAQVGASLAEGLAAAHAVGVVHRDLKPENVLLDANGRVLLSDFGIALVHDPAKSGRDEPGAILGTPAYMAPEQVEGAPVGPPADVFALGVVLFEALSGYLPYQGEGAIGMAVARLHRPPAELPADRPIPPELADLVRACLRPAAADRPTGADIAKALGRFLQGRASAEASAAGWTTTSRGLGFPYAPGRRALACPAFVYRGPAEHDYLGEALACELIDVLSRTRNLRVLSNGATRNVGSRDPRQICAELAVEYVVDGTVQLAGDALRIDVRLADATGAQLSAERFDEGWGDVLHVQERAGKRIAEALRLELTTRTARDGVPEEAMELYLRARRAIRSFVFAEVPRTVDMLERALALAPGFAPAIAAYALATVQMWFLPQGATTVRDWRRIAGDSVALALQQAPDLAETHVAAARFASHSGDLLGAVHALRRALDVAPTCPEAQTLMGQLECETGRVDAGLARLRVAHDLEPTGGVYLYEAGRVASFAGDHAGFRRRLEDIGRMNPGLVEAHLALRHALWWHDDALLEQAVTTSKGSSVAALFTAVARAVRGEVPVRDAIELLSMVTTYVNPRFAGLLRQIGVELHLRRGELVEAVLALQAAHRTLLYDLLWLERCPLLVPIRGTREFQAVLAEVRVRCDEVWAK